MKTRPEDLVRHAEMSEGAEPGCLMQLPNDVWQRISDHFTTREWVKGCGSVNKLLHQLQPAHVEISTSKWNISRFVPGNMEAVTGYKS